MLDVCLLEPPFQLALYSLWPNMADILAAFLVRVEAMVMMDWVQELVEKQVRLQLEELEKQAKIFLRMGYEVSELTIVQHDDGSQEISPLFAIT